MKKTAKLSNYDKYYKDLVPIVKKEKNQKYFFIILSLTVSIFFFIFAINPTLSTIAKLKKQITDARYVEEKLTQKIQNLSSLSQQYQEIRNDIPLIMDAIPNEPDAPSLVGQIQTVGKDSNVQLNNVEILPVNLVSVSSTTSSSFSFNVSGSGSYENTQKFIDDLTNMQRALAIESVQLSKGAENDLFSFTIQGLAYYKK